MVVENVKSSRLENIKASLYENHPVSWIQTTLGACFKWGNGGTPKRGVTKYYCGEIPWLVIGDLNDGYVNASAHTITQEGLRNSSAKIVSAGLNSFREVLAGLRH